MIQHPRVSHIITSNKGSLTELISLITSYTTKDQNKSRDAMDVPVQRTCPIPANSRFLRYQLCSILTVNVSRKSAVIAHTSQ